MATTSIWAVKGWLGKVVLYIENPDKTDNPKFYRQEELTDVQTQSLSDVIDYAVRAEKTTVTPDDESAMVVRQFISGINCLPSTARDEMLAVKKRFGKEDGVIAYHGYQSFASGEATPELAHEIGVKLAQRLWGERYQVLVATHLDTPQADAFKSYCVSYMLCRKYGVDTQGYDFSRLPDELKNAEPQTIRGELTDIRDTLQTMTGKMVRTLEQSRTAAQKETGKER